MRHHHKAFSLGIILSLIFFLVQSASGQHTVSHSVFGNGCAVITGNAQRIIGTAGQPLIGVVSNSAYINEVGFWYQCGGLVTSVEQISSNLPTEYRLKQNYPNPFNPSTIISWQLPVGSQATLIVYDILGREVATLVNEYKQAGKYETEFNAEAQPSGVYFYQLRAGDYTSVKKMIFLK